MGNINALCLKVALAALFCFGTLRAQCLDGSGNASRNFDLYIENADCLESLRDWGSFSPGRLEALDEVMSEHFSRHPLKVFRLRRSMEERLSGEGLAMKVDDNLTYGMVLEDGLKWEVTNMLAGIIAGGGGYYAMYNRFRFKRIEALDKRFNNKLNNIFKNRAMRFILRNPYTFGVGIVAAVVTGETAMGAMEFFHLKYLEKKIEWNIRRLNGGDDSEALKDIAENTMAIVAIKGEGVF